LQFPDEWTNTARQREICITFRQSPKGMQMLRQYHHRDDVKRMGLSNFSHGVANHINVLGEEAAFSIGEIDSEKIRGSSCVRSAVSHQGHLIECWADKALAQPWLKNPQHPHQFSAICFISQDFGYLSVVAVNRDKRWRKIDICIKFLTVQRPW